MNNLWCKHYICGTVTWTGTWRGGGECGLHSSYVNVGWIAIQENVTPCLPSSGFFVEPKAYCCVHKIQPQSPFLSQMNPVHIVSLCFLSIYCNTVLLIIASSFLHSDFLTKIFIRSFLPYVFCVSCPCHIWLGHYRITLLFVAHFFPRVLLLFFLISIFFCCFLFLNVLGIFRLQWEVMIHSGRWHCAKLYCVDGNNQ